MPRLSVVREVALEKTPRAIQTQGIFDVASAEMDAKSWVIDYDIDFDWNIGLIVGPSGAGKSTIATDMFGDRLVDGWEWPRTKPIVDGFSSTMTIQEITGVLSSVGFSSPPGWLKPFHVLSNGEQFRVNLARTLSECPDLAVVDEFTSVIDRTVARVGSAAVQKSVRRKQSKFVAVSCHYDIVDWLDPDWIIEPHTQSFQRRSLQGRPSIDVEIKRTRRESWELFKPHHYLTGTLHSAAKCFAAFVDDKPAAFTSIIPYMGKKGVWRGHRSVCLPDFQGIGLGARLVEHIAAAVKGVGYRYVTSTSHPALINSRSRSPNWKMTRKPDLKSALKKKMGKEELSLRLMASFEYIGEPLSEDVAYALWRGK